METLQKLSNDKAAAKPVRAAFTSNDWCNALALVKHLEYCHRAALEVPGSAIALKSSTAAGIHYDPAFRFVDDHLYSLRCRCEREIKELDALIKRRGGSAAKNRRKRSRV